MTAPDLRRNSRVLLDGPDRAPARAMLKGIGFTKEGTLAGHYGPGRNAVMMRVLAPEWKRRWQAPLCVAA